MFRIRFPSASDIRFPVDIDFSAIDFDPVDEKRSRLFFPEKILSAAKENGAESENR